MKELIKKAAIIFLLINSISVSNLIAGDTPVAAKNHEEFVNRENNGINIRELIKRQVQASEQKQLNRYMETSLHDIIRIESEDNNITKLSSVKKSTLIQGYDLGLLIFIGAVISAILIILARRFGYRKIETEDDLQLLKRRISMIRNEEPLFSDDKELKKVRKNLYKESLIEYDEVENRNGKYRRNKNPVQSAGLKQNPLNKLSDNISTRAKELNISIGELMLVLKIKSYKMNEI